MKKENVVKNVVTGLIIALLVVAVTLLGINLAFTIQNSKKETPPLTSVQIAEKILPSVVETNDGDQVASGALVSCEKGKNYIISNRHAALKDKVNVRFFGETDFVAGKLIKFDDYHDIAIIFVEHVPLFAAPATINLAPLANGEKVFVAGNAMGEGVSVVDGLVSKNNRFLTVQNITNTTEKTVPVYQISAPVNAGASGGGLFNCNGELVGINAYQSRYINEDSDRFVDGVSYSVPSAIAMSVYSAGVRTDTLEADLLFAECAPYKDTFEIRIFSLGIYIIAKDSGYTVSKGGKTKEMSEPILNDDRVKKIGALDINTSTTNSQIFAELYRYKNSPGENNLKVVVLRGDKTVEITYANKTL